MAEQYQHQVCYSVYERVTFVNGQWQGDDVPESDRTPEDAQSCPVVWDYLAKAGADGWQLVAVIETDHPGPNQPNVRTLYLKRQAS